MGAALSIDDRLAAAQAAVELAVFGADPSALDAAATGLATLEAQLLLARGQLFHAWFLADGTIDESERDCFQRAVALSAAAGDVSGEAAARFWLGCWHQVVRHDDDAAVPELDAAVALALDDPLTMSYALRHLGIAAHRAGDVDAARRQLEESTRLRRELGFDAGVAANLVGLAYVAQAEGRDPHPFLDEAQSLAADAPAVLAQVDSARTTLS